MKKRKYAALVSAFLLLVTVATGCGSDSGEKEKGKAEVSAEIQSITTDELKESYKDKDWKVVDTRINDAYNGWALDGVERGGHIEGAVDFSANWLEVEKDGKEEILEEALSTKGIDKEKNIVLYDDNGEDAKAVADYLSEKGYENLYSYDVKEWAADESLPMESYDNYELLVPAKVVKDVIDGKKPESFEDSGEIKIAEVSWGEEETSYAKGHVPTSFHINTDWIEPPPAWMLASDEELAELAKKLGLAKDDTVIVTGEATMATYRAAVVLRYIGVEDVRVLNGGNMAWTNAGYELETASNKPTPVEDFGGDVPGNPDLIDTIEEAKAGLEKPEEFMLVDNRTREEYIGEVSGYSYHEKKGRIPGAVFGYAGKSDSNSLDYYRNIDDTMRNADEISDMWKEAGIDTSKHLSFMCGSGWRAAEVLTYANVMGLENTSLYSDGWIGWSNDESNPTETGEPEKQ